MQGECNSEWTGACTSTKNGWTFVCILLTWVPTLPQMFPRVCFIWSPVTITSMQTQGVIFSTILRLWTKLLPEPHQIDFHHRGVFFFFFNNKGNSSHIPCHVTTSFVVTILFERLLEQQEWHIVHLFDVYMEILSCKTEVCCLHVIVHWKL